MPILVLNGGSSSLKFSLYDRVPALEHILDGEVTGVGADAQLEVHARGGSGLGRRKSPVKAERLYDALALVLDELSGPMVPPIEAVGYRVVHPGPHLVGHQRITPQVLQQLEAAASFAPLHDPPARELMTLAMQRFPRIPHFACFDTEFHRTMPPEASTYALPEQVRAQGVHRYGFHGLSCESIVAQLEATGHVPERLAIAHLGSGCSLTAVRGGKSVDNTMGLTPTGGLVMGTRPGDLDPGLMLYLERHAVADHVDDPATEVETMLNQHAGLVALSGQPNDLRKIRWAASGGDAKAQLALAVFIHSIRKALGAACFTLGGLDSVVFTGGIGEHDAATRAEVVAGLEALGLALDLVRNDDQAAAGRSSVRDITASNPESSDTSPGTSILVLPAQEDWIIARHVDRLLHQAK